MPSNANRALVVAYMRDAELKGLARGTLGSYGSGLNALLDFLGSKSFLTVTKEELKTFLGHLKRKALHSKTIGNRFNAVSSFYEFLAFEERMKYNPVPAFQKRYLLNVRRDGLRTRGQRQLLSVEEMRRLVHSVADVRDRAVIV